MFHANARQMSAFNFPMVPFPFYHSNFRQKPAENPFKVLKTFDIFELPKHTIKVQIVLFKEQPNVSVSKFFKSSSNPEGVPTGKGIFMPVDAWRSLCESLDTINKELNSINKTSSVACMKLNFKKSIFYYYLYCHYINYYTLCINKLNRS